MRILMIGWEFQPFHVGGLGRHAYYLTRSLAARGHQITYVMPLWDPNFSLPWLKIVQVPLKMKIGPYMMISGERVVGYPREPIKGAKEFAKNVFEVIKRLFKPSDFDLVHCHDWITYLAAKQIKEAFGIPLVITFHATEFSRTADRPNPEIVKIERDAVKNADAIIAVSNILKRELIERLGADESKIFVIHNAIDTRPFEQVNVEKWKGNKKLVLFLGRLTFQKGPEFFIRAAKKVLEVRDDVVFVVAGKGFLLPSLMEEAARLGIADKVLFLGFVPEEKLPKLLKMADVYVMPSVYEPFGIIALEALAAGTPIIVSRSAGVLEKISSALTVDFWNVDEIATKILMVLDHPVLSKEITKNGYFEIRRYTWDSVAQLTEMVYRKIVGR